MLLENTNTEIKCLDHGFVRLVDRMGDDVAITQAARVSYGTGTTAVTKDRGLIRYLMRHWHTTPFEMVEFKFHCKLPIMVARQWIRHRTANVNEYSGRYSILDNEFFIPEIVNVQSTENMQGRGEEVDDMTGANFLSNLDKYCAQGYKLYEDALERGVARETARMYLPNNIYTQWYWKIDLHNLFHFLFLRRDSHAQYEIRVFADAMYELIKPYVPIAIEAWEDYRFESANLSVMILDALRDIPEIANLVLTPTSKLSQREIDDFRKLMEKQV